MNSTGQGSKCACAPPRKTKTIRTPQIRASPEGGRFSLRQLPPEREMRVPSYRISSLIRAEDGNISRCTFSFHITGRALVLHSLSWKSRSSRKRNFVDEVSCRTLINILDGFAVYHKATRIYASRRKTPLPMLLNLGFCPAGMHDFLEKKVQKNHPKSLQNI